MVHCWVYKDCGFKDLKPKRTFSKAAKLLAKREGISREEAKRILWEQESHGPRAPQVHDVLRFR